jgi:hypothetical protein
LISVMLDAETVVRFCANPLPQRTQRNTESRRSFFKRHS